jgi:hypothetical protein
VRFARYLNARSVMATGASLRLLGFPAPVDRARVSPGSRHRRSLRTNCRLPTPLR